MLVDEMSVGQIPIDKMSVYEMPVGKTNVNEMFAKDICVQNNKLTYSGA
jgi:hypothetical protein